MPADTRFHACVLPTDQHAQIWRYLDLPRFILLLERREIYFRRCDLFDDHRDSRWPQKNLDQFRVSLGLNPLEGFSESDKHEFIEQSLSKLAASPSSFTYASCWCMLPHESAVLWGTGIPRIAIRSTYAKLVEVLPSYVKLTTMQYIDHSTTSISNHSIHSPLCHKAREFEAEHELRAYMVLPDECWSPRASNGQRHGVSPMPDGVSRPVDLEKLITAVVLDPKADPMLRDAVAALTRRLLPRARLEPSSLTPAHN